MKSLFRSQSTFQPILWWRSYWKAEFELFPRSSAALELTPDTSGLTQWNLWLLTHAWDGEDWLELQFIASKEWTSSWQLARPEKGKAQEDDEDSQGYRRIDINECVWDKLERVCQQLILLGYPWDWWWLYSSNFEGRQVNWEDWFNDR